MTILDCSVTGCMYNEANCCHKGNIKVEGEDAKESEDTCCGSFAERGDRCAKNVTGDAPKNIEVACCACLLYTSDAADEEDSGDLGGCRIVKKKKRRGTEGRSILKKKQHKHSNNHV